jgi:hypothetical protein
MLAFEDSDFDESKTKILQTHMEQALEILLNQRKMSKKERGITETTDNLYG